MGTRRFDKKFSRTLLICFLIYLIVIPLIYFILDKNSFYELFRKDILQNILKISGIALGVALIMALWLRKDPELRKW